MADDTLDNRKQAAAKILASPASYKVCECCGSIVLGKAVVCPLCNAYRFDATKEAVIRQAGLLASRDRQSLDFSDYQ